MEITFLALTFLLLALIHISLKEVNMPFVFSGFAGMLSLIMGSIAENFFIMLFLIFLGFALIGKSVVEVTSKMGE